MNPVAGVKAVKTSETKTAPAQAAEVKNSPAVSSGRVISREDLNKRIQSGEAIQIVNVLDPEKYTLGFIKGSKKIPLDKLDARSSELDKSKPVVTYCASNECNASKLATEKLMEKGFNVRAYEGGIKEWKEAGLPTEA